MSTAAPSAGCRRPAQADRAALAFVSAPAPVSGLALTSALAFCSALAACAATAAIVLFALSAMLAPATASASTLIVHTLKLGTPGHGFGLTGVTAAEKMGLAVTGSSSDRTLTLDPRVLSSTTLRWSVSGGTGSVQWLGKGSKLVCAGGQVEELDASGSSIWSYPNDGSYPSLVAPCWAREFTASDDDTWVLVADPGAGRVVAVDLTTPGKTWQYSGAGAYRLSEPVCARYVPAGTGGQPTVLIADDDSAAPKVLEVAWADGSVVWHYGGTPGTGDGQLMGPTDAERESDGSTLIADAGADRAIRVSDDAVLWQYGVSGSAGSDAGYLDNPMGASMEAGGKTIIADTGNDRVLVVSNRDYLKSGGTTHGFTAASIVWRSPKGAGGHLDQPRLAERVTGRAGPSDTADVVTGAFLVCDQSGQHVGLVGNTSGARVMSKTFYLAGGGSQAHLLSLRVRAGTPGHTSVSVHYVSSDGISRSVTGAGSYSLRGVVTATISFDFVFSSADRSVAPSLKDVELTYTNGETKASSSGNGGATHGNGTASGAGTGTGSGVGGSGSGSGVGAGQGTSTDLGGGGTAATSGKSSASRGASLTMPTTPQPAAASGTGAGAVTGTLVNVGDLSGGARGGGGGSPPPRTSRAAAYLGVSLVALLLAALLPAPGLLASRRMARLRSVDHADELEGWG